MCLFTEALSLSAAIICLACLLEEYTLSLFCSSSAARKSQPGELSPSSLPSWAATALLHNSVFPALLTRFQTCSSHHVINVPAPAPASSSAKVKGGSFQVGSMTGLLLLYQWETIFSQPRVPDKAGILPTATFFQGRCLCPLHLDNTKWLLYPMDLPKRCILEPSSHANSFKLTVPSGS